MENMNAEGKKSSAKGIVLVVDDNPSNLNVLSSMLREEGYEVHPAILALEIRIELLDTLWTDRVRKASLCSVSYIALYLYPIVLILGVSFLKSNSLAIGTNWQNAFQSFDVRKGFLKFLNFLSE
jgi:hypothetical protein